MKNLKFVVLISTLMIPFFPIQKSKAELWLSDNFNVTGGGDLNHDVEGGRQSGTYAPYYYNLIWHPATVTNGGPYAGKCNMEGLLPAMGSMVSISDNMVDSHSYTVEYELDHYSGGAGEWFGMDIGKDGAVFPDTGVGLGLEFFNDGSYIFFSYTNVSANFPAGTLTYPVKIKVCVKQAGVGQDALVSMFVNGNAYPVETPFNKAVHTYPNGFTNNYLTWGALTPAKATMDNFRLSSAENTVAQVTSWTGDSDSGISTNTMYTHAINLNLETNVSINDVLFEGAGTELSGTNWMLRTAPGISFTNTYMNKSGLEVNLSGNSFFLGTGAVYALTHCSTLSITNLNPKLLYRLTMYGCGYDASSKVYLTALDGGGKSGQIGMAENGLGNGQKITYDYLPDVNGEFSIAASSIPGASTNEWYWFAFSNEILVPETPTGATASQGEYLDKVRVSWDEMKGTEYYSIFRNTTNFPGSSTNIVGQFLSNSYDDTSVTIGQHYYYWVQACSTAGCSALSVPVLGYTKSDIPPDKPVNLSPVDFNIVTSPITLVASAFSDPGTNAFAASQWQVSTNADFSPINWNSGETIPAENIIPPSSVIPDGTNYWRVRYKNDRNTWSAYSETTSFIFVKGEIQAGIFLDTFNVAGTGNVNYGYAAAGRQFGSATPLTYTASGSTKIGSASANPGELLLGQNSGCSPNYSFTESGEFIIEFDVENHKLDGSADWLSLSFGKSDNSDLSPISPSGAGLVFSANGDFKAYDSTTLVGSGNGVPTTEKIHVTLVASTEAFDNDTARYSAFVNGTPMLISTAKNGYIYDDGDGFRENYITIFNNNSASTNSSLIDNLKVSKALTNEVRISRFDSDSTSLIDPLNEYTHAVNFNGDPVEINGVQFEGTGHLTNWISFPNGSSMIKTNDWEIMGGHGSITFIYFSQLSPTISGNSKELLEYMIYGGEPGAAFAIKLTNLIPYSSNTFSLYSYAWESSGRTAFISGLSGGKITSVDQDTYGQGIGIIVQHDYIASGDGTFTFVASPDFGAGFITAGFSSEMTGVPEPELFWILNFGFWILYVTKRLTSNV